MHYAVKKAFNPIIIVPELVCDQFIVKIVSEKLQPADLLLAVYTLSFKGDKLYSKRLKVTAPAYNSVQVASISKSSLNIDCKEQECVVYLQLLSEDGDLLAGSHFFFDNRNSGYISDSKI